MAAPEALDRRQFLRGAGITGAGVLAAACAPAAPSPDSPTAPGASGQAGWEREWQELVAAAKKEGEFVYDVTRSTSGAAKRIVPDFEAAFPGIKVTQTTSDSSNVFAQRVLQEQRAGIFTWDLLFMSTAPFLSLIPEGALVPLRPLIFRPDVLDDNVWHGGFEVGWLDVEKKWGYGANLNMGPGVWINTDMVRDGEIKSASDLLASKWQGKIAWADPRVNGFGFGPLTAARVVMGEEAATAFTRKVLVEQKAALNRDTRQLTEWMVRGNYAIGVGVVLPVLAEFQSQGLGKSLKRLALQEFRYASSNKPVFLPKQVPHPNAAKLFLNWWLTKEGQTAWAEGAEVNSRRKDIRVVDEHSYPEPGVPIPLILDSETGSKEADKTITLCKEILN